MHITIDNYADTYENDVKDLLVELQTHIASLDKRKVIVVKSNYRDDYFVYVMQEIEKHSGKIFVAKVDDKICGMIVCKIFQGGGEDELTTSCPKIGFISDLVVKTAYRGQGIGTTLLATAEDYFEQNGCEYTQLEVFAPNTQAAKLYSKLGFEINCCYLSKRTGKK